MQEPSPCPKCGGPRVWYVGKTQRYSRCKPCAAAKVLAQYHANRERYLERMRVWRTANPDKMAAANKRWHDANRERVAELNREYYEQNRESEIARSLAYTKSHPEVDAAIKHRRNARKRATVCEHGDGCVTSALIAELRAMVCWYCGGSMQEIDHFVPLARGGSHCRENLVPACKPCNNSKHAQDPEKWLARRRRERVA